MRLKRHFSCSAHSFSLIGNNAFAFGIIDAFWREWLTRNLFKGVNQKRNKHASKGHSQARPLCFAKKPTEKQILKQRPHSADARIVTI
jgi:hypothetical protein